MRKAKNKAEAEIILSVEEIKGKLFDRVIDLINEYTIVYGSPNFVKIPQWIYDSSISFRDYLNLDGGMPETL